VQCSAVGYGTYPATLHFHEHSHVVLFQNEFTKKWKLLYIPRYSHKIFKIKQQQHHFPNRVTFQTNNSSSRSLNHAYQVLNKTTAAAAASIMHKNVKIKQQQQQQQPPSCMKMSK
jgi:hypothetical protein